MLACQPVIEQFIHFHSIFSTSSAFSMCTVHSIHPSTRSFMQSKLNRLPCCKNKYHVILVKFSGSMSVFVSCDKLDFKAQLMSTRYFASD